MRTRSYLKGLRLVEQERPIAQAPHPTSPREEAGRGVAARRRAQECDRGRSSIAGDHVMAGQPRTRGVAKPNGSRRDRSASLALTPIFGYASDGNSARQPRNPGGNEHEPCDRTPRFAEGDGSDDHHCGGIAGGLGADARALVGGERGAEVEGAGGRLRLSHAHLRSPLSRRAQCEAAAGGCDCGRLSSVAEAARPDAQRGGHTVDLRHRQFRRRSTPSRSSARRREASLSSIPASATPS